MVEGLASEVCNFNQWFGMCISKLRLYVDPSRIFTRGPLSPRYIMVVDEHSQLEVPTRTCKSDFYHSSSAWCMVIVEVNRALKTQIALNISFYTISLFTLATCSARILDVPAIEPE